LKPDIYEGKVKVSPMNGKPASRTFTLSYDSEKKTPHLTIVEYDRFVTANPKSP